MRALSSVVSKLHVNDIELYSYLMSKCYLEIPSIENQEAIKNHIDNMNQLAVKGPYIEDGIISSNYAQKIQKIFKKARDASILVKMP